MCAGTSYPAKYPSLPREEKRGIRNWSLVGDGPLATDANIGGGNAPMLVVRPPDANPGANRDGARVDSFPRPGVAGAGCRVDRDRTATRRCSLDRTAMHARHGQRLALALCPLHSLSAGPRLRGTAMFLRAS